MDKLKTDINGGYPFELDDLRWIADGIDQAFFGVGSGFSDGTEGNSFLLSGGDVTINGANLDVSAGYAWYKGEVVKIDAHSVLDGGIAKLHFWKLVVTYDPAGDEIFEDSSANSTYEVRRLEVTQEDLDATPVDPFFMNRAALNSNRLSDILADPAEIAQNAADIVSLNATLTSILQTWQELPFVPGDYSLGGTATYTVTSGEIGYKRNGKTLHVRFDISLNVTGAGTVVLDAPLADDQTYGATPDYFTVVRADKPGSTPEAGQIALTTSDQKFQCSLMNTSESVATGTLRFSGQFTIDVA